MKFRVEIQENSGKPEEVRHMGAAHSFEEALRNALQSLVSYRAGIPEVVSAQGVQEGPEATRNRFLVGVLGTDIVAVLLGLRLNVADAQSLGVWLCALAFDGPEEAAAAITAACNT